MTIKASRLDQLPVSFLAAPQVAQYLKPLTPLSRACIDKFDLLLQETINLKEFI